MSAPQERRVSAPQAPRIDPEAVRAYRLEAQIGYLIRRAHQRASAIFETVMRDFAITPVQFAALAKLHDLGPASQTQLGRQVGIDPATMNGVTRRLAARGLLRAGPDPDDGRLVRLALTAEGRGLVEGMKSRGAEVTARTLDPLTPDEAAELTRLIAKLG